MLVSDQEVLSSSLTQYSDYMKSAKKSSSKDGAAMVTRVGKKIAAATEQYLRNNGLESEIKNFAWEFNLVNDPQVNAFCMPGGKIVVYEGLMQLVSSDDELSAWSAPGATPEFIGVCQSAGADFAFLGLRTCKTSQSRI